MTRRWLVAARRGLIALTARDAGSTRRAAATTSCFSQMPMDMLAGERNGKGRVLFSISGDRHVLVMLYRRC